MNKIKKRNPILFKSRPHNDFYREFILKSTEDLYKTPFNKTGIEHFMESHGVLLNDRRNYEGRIHLMRLMFSLKFTLSTSSDVIGVKVAGLKCADLIEQIIKKSSETLKRQSPRKFDETQIIQCIESVNDPSYIINKMPILRRAGKYKFDVTVIKRELISKEDTERCLQHLWKKKLSYFNSED